MAQAGAVNIKIGASTVEFQRALTSASDSVQQFRTNFKQAFDSLKGSADKPYGAFNALNGALSQTKRQMQDILAVGGKVPAELSNKFKALKSTVDEVNGAFSSTGKGGGFGGIAGELTGVAAGFFGVQAAIAGIQKGLTIASEFQRMDTALKAVSSSAADYARTQQFLQGTADTLGLSYQALAESYKGLKAATNGTVLEGKETEKIFLAVTRSAAALQLSADDTKGALLALQQMVSKGTVSAEELRGQLGERLPGAFRLMAQGLGVTEQELGKMMQRGEVLATDALPKLAEQLEKTYGAQAQANVATMAGGFQRLKDQAALFVAEFMDQSGVTSFFAKVTNGIADTLGGMRKAIQSKEWLTFFAAMSPNAAGGAVREGFAIQKQRQATVDEFKGMTPGLRQARVDMLGEEYARINKQIAERKDTVFGGGLDALNQRKADIEYLMKTLPKVNAEMRRSERKETATKPTATVDPIAGSFDKVQKRYKELQDLMKDYQIRGVAAPKAVAAEYEKLKSKVEGVSDSFKKQKDKKVTLLDISDAGIYQRALDATLKNDPGNIEKIANLRELIKDAKSLESGKRLLFDVPDKQMMTNGFMRSKGEGQPMRLIGNINKFSTSQSDIQDAAQRYGEAKGQMNLNIFDLESAKPQIKLFDEFSKTMLQRTKQLGDDISSALQGAAASAAVGMGELIGGLIAGTQKLSDLPKMIAGVFADLAKNMGKSLITFGTAGLAAKAFVNNPATAIVAGIGLVALGSALQATMQKQASSAFGKPRAFASGGIISGPTLGLVGEYPGARTGNPEVIAPLDKLKSMIGPSGAQVFIPDIMLRGSDIRIALRREERSNNDKTGVRS